jgi:hypothetical protein
MIKFAAHREKEGQKSSSENFEALSAIGTLAILVLIVLLVQLLVLQYAEKITTERSAFGTATPPAAEEKKKEMQAALTRNQLIALLVSHLRSMIERRSQLVEKHFFALLSVLGDIASEDRLTTFRQLWQCNAGTRNAIALLFDKWRNIPAPM